MLRTLGSVTLLLCIAWSAVLADETEKGSAKAIGPVAKPSSGPAAELGTAPMLRIEVLIADLRRSDAGKGDAIEPATDPKARIEQLEKADKLHALTRVQLTTVDGQKALLQLGQRVGRITSITTTRAGQVNSVQTEDVGLRLIIKPKIRRDGLVVMDIDIQRSQFGAAEDGPVISKPSEGEAIRVAPIENLSTQTTIIAGNAQSVIVMGEQTKQPRQSELLIVVTPQLIGK